MIDHSAIGLLAIVFPVWFRLCRLRFKRIRHYGVLAPAAKAHRLAAARTLLAMPAPNPRLTEDAQAFMRRVTGVDILRCPHCAHGVWRVVEQLPPGRAAVAASAPVACRGPP
jgi:hypothetical protein